MTTPAEELRRAAALETPGRRSGRVISFPAAIADFEGERYPVSMLGKDVNWVRNLKAAGGQAVLRHGRRESVHMEEVEPGARTPILRRYLQVAPAPGPTWRSTGELRSLSSRGSPRTTGVPHPRWRGLTPGQQRRAIAAAG